MQVETGATVSRSATSVGEALVRVRLLPALEARATLSRSYTRGAAGGWTTDAPTLGVKVALATGATEAAVLADASRDEARAVLLARRALSPRLSAAANLGAGRPLRGIDRRVAGFATLSLGAALDRGLGVFAEIAALGITSGRRPVGLADIGLTVPIGARVQADARVGVEGSEAFAGAGLVVRLPR